MNNYEDYLINALNNEKNTPIINLNNEIIMREKNDILQKIQIKGEYLKQMHKKLKNYRYISSMNDVVIGNYIRWINLEKAVEEEEIKLTNGGFICDICNYNSENQETSHILCKNAFNRIFELNVNKTIIFQKINFQEGIILSALNYIQK